MHTGRWEQSAIRLSSSDVQVSLSHRKWGDPGCHDTPAAHDVHLRHRASEGTSSTSSSWEKITCDSAPLTKDGLRMSDERGGQGSSLGAGHAAVRSRTAGQAAPLGAVCTNTTGHRTFGTGLWREEAFVRWISFSGPPYWEVIEGSHYLHLQNEHRVTGSQTLQLGKTPARWAESGPCPTQDGQTQPRSQRLSHTTAADLLTQPHTDRDAGS